MFGKKKEHEYSLFLPKTRISEHDTNMNTIPEGEKTVCSAYSILPPMVVNVYVAYIVYRTLRVVVIPT
jgi:hypothetical protein